MSVCLIVQPIHAAGTERLAAAGLTPRPASGIDEATLAREIGDAVAVITRDAGLTRRVLTAARELLVIGNHGAGTDPVDVVCATELRVPVVYTPGANAAAVAEHAIALMLAVAKRVVPADRAVRGGSFDYRYGPGTLELSGKALGVVGWGPIGRRTAAMARAAFGMTVLVFSPSADARAIAAEGARKVERLDELLAAADVISVHAPLRPETRGLIGAAEIARMRPDAILVNTGRGAVVDEAALAAALRERRIAGAGLDVFGEEPPPADHPLLGLDNAVLSPHLAGSSREALERTALMVTDGIADVLAGRRPLHLVNPEVWERRRGGPADRRPTRP